MKDKPDEEKVSEFETTSDNAEKKVTETVCRKIFSGIKESPNSRWKVEFSRRFGPN